MRSRRGESSGNVRSVAEYAARVERVWEWVIWEGFDSAGVF